MPLIMEGEVNLRGREGGRNLKMHAVLLCSCDMPVTALCNAVSYPSECMIFGCHFADKVFALYGVNFTTMQHSYMFKAHLISMHMLC